MAKQSHDGTLSGEIFHAHRLSTHAQHLDIGLAARQSLVNPTKQAVEMTWESITKAVNPT